jgi:hypothetical protein
MKAFESTTASTLPSVMVQAWPFLEKLFATFMNHEAIVDKLCDLAKCISASAGDECLGDKFVNVMCIMYARNHYGILTATIGYLISKSISHFLIV